GGAGAGGVHRLGDNRAPAQVVVAVVVDEVVRRRLHQDPPDPLVVVLRALHGAQVVGGVVGHRHGALLVLHGRRVNLGGAAAEHVVGVAGGHRFGGPLPRLGGLLVAVVAARPDHRHHLVGGVVARLGGPAQVGRAVRQDAPLLGSRPVVEGVVTV